MCIPTLCHSIVLVIFGLFYHHHCFWLPLPYLIRDSFLRLIMLQSKLSRSLPYLARFVVWDISCSCPTHQARIILGYIGIKIIVKPSYSYVKVCLYDWYHISFVYTVVERHNVVVVAKEPFNFCLHKYIWYDIRQIICCDLLPPVQYIGLWYDLNDFLQLFKLASWRLLLFDPLGFFYSHLPSVSTLLVNFYPKNVFT